MTTPTERAAEAIDRTLNATRHIEVDVTGDRHWFAENLEVELAQALADANLLAAPVDGELREALTEEIRRHAAVVYDREKRQYNCHGCGALVHGRTELADVAEYRHQAHALLPIIAAHVAEEKRKLREEIAAEMAAHLSRCHGIACDYLDGE